MGRGKPARELLLAVLGVAVAAGYGLDLLGTPLRLVHILTIVPLSMAAGVAVARAVAAPRDRR